MRVLDPRRERVALMNFLEVFPSVGNFHSQFYSPYSVILSYWSSTSQFAILNFSPYWWLKIFCIVSSNYYFLPQLNHVPGNSAGSSISARDSFTKIQANRPEMPASFPSSPRPENGTMPGESREVMPLSHTQGPGR